MCISCKDWTVNSSWNRSLWISPPAQNFSSLLGPFEFQCNRMNYKFHDCCLSFDQSLSIFPHSLINLFYEKAVSCTHNSDNELTDWFHPAEMDNKVNSLFRFPFQITASYFSNKSGGTNFIVVVSRLLIQKVIRLKHLLAALPRVNDNNLTWNRLKVVSSGFRW